MAIEWVPLNTEIVGIGKHLEEQMPKIESALVEIGEGKRNDGRVTLTIKVTFKQESDAIVVSSESGLKMPSIAPAKGVVAVFDHDGRLVSAPAEQLPLFEAAVEAAADEAGAKVTKLDFGGRDSDDE